MDEKKEFAVSEHAVHFGPDSPTTPEEREARQTTELKLESGPTEPLEDPYWKPGYLSRFPWLGFGALLVILICAVGSVLTLQLSNGVSQSKWPKAIAPNVIISTMNSVSNICFGIAISNGIAVAWWRKTLRGSSIQQLNRSWKFSTSIKDVVLGAKYFNFIALAALAAKLTIIDATLLQRAFSTEIRPDSPVQTNLTGYANTTIPNTGRVSDGSAPGLLAKNFNDDLKIWLQGAGELPNTYTNCDGLCYLNVPGAGFEVDCSELQSVNVDNGKQTEDASVEYADNQFCASANGTRSKKCTDLRSRLVAPLFHLEFAAHFDNATSQYSYITMDLLYTTAKDAGPDGSYSCPGVRYTQSCILRPAVINYPVKIQAFAESHALPYMTLAVDPDDGDSTTFRLFNHTTKQQNYFEVLRYNDVHETHLQPWDDTRTRLGGLVQGFNEYLAGTANMHWGGTAGFILNQDGNAPAYLSNDLGTQQQGQAQSTDLCGFQFNDPMVPQTFANNAAADPSHSYDVPSIVGKINQIMFALALDISNEDDDKDVAAGTLSRPATVYRDTIHYVTNKEYMWGAFASILFCVLCVLPVYWGYWQLGRAVTLGPFEIAAAFRAPNLHHRSNAPIDEVIKEVGDRRVKFGQILAGDGAGQIGVAEPEQVVRIHPSAKAAHNSRISSP